MTNQDKNRVIVLAIIEGGMSQTEAAQRYGVSTRWIRELLNRYHHGGLQALTPRSKAPHTTPHAYPSQTINQILTLRDTLQNEGLDCGPQSIWDRLPPDSRPSPTTIWRILRRHNKIINQPHKRPRSSWHRFEATAPNEMWQSDFTHVSLHNGTNVEVIDWLDDHSRYLLHLSAHPRITTPIVIDTFTQATDTYGLPASTLTDNAMVYTTRLAAGNNNNKTQPNGFEQLLADLHITQKNGRPNHPTTQGKVERLHQTLKLWLTAQPPAHTINELNTQLATFTHIYNHERPHRSLGRRTPHQAYTATPKTFPTMQTSQNIWRVRYDKVDQNGKITLRYAGKLRKLYIAYKHRGTHVITLIHNNHTITINQTTGEIIAEHTLNPNTIYQPRTEQ